jgi:hypothetical protein
MRGVFAVDADDARSVAWDWLQNHGVDDAEDSGIGADAEREHQYRDGRKARIQHEQPDAVPQILHEAVHD